MADNDFGPKWTVNSEEVGGGIAILLVFAAAMFIVAPAFIIGSRLGAAIWDVKIFKYPLGVAFAIGYMFLLKNVFLASKISALIVIIGTWLLLDFLGAKMNIKNMWIVRKTIATFKWLFSA
jgi:hypothetical protein